MSFNPGTSRGAGHRFIQGTKPGVLDSTQPARLLRDKLGVLSFAAFDPLTATGASSRRRVHSPDNPRPKRIVVESVPGRAQHRWRFVPNARRAPGVEDEGSWPRKVTICGEQYLMSQDQWDIYKLDPAYDCFVAPLPNLPIITLKELSTQESLDPRSSTSEHTRKRRISTPDDTEDRTNNINKRFRTALSLVTESESTDQDETTDTDEEDEVEEIVVDEFEHQDRAASQERLKQHRKARARQTKERREKLKSKTGSSFETTRSVSPEIVDLTMEDITPSDSTPPYDRPTGAPPKRKVFTGAESSEESPHARRYQPNKRARTHSPTRTRADLNKRRMDRDRRRQAQFQERFQHMTAQREQQLWEEILADSPMGTPPPSSKTYDTSQSPGASGVNGHGADSDIPSPQDEDAERRATIEESRRKLAELEKDRPLWEAQARKRTMQERADEEDRRLRKEEERRRAQELQLQEEQRRRSAEAAAAEVERRARAEKARVIREREEQRRRERERWSYGPWTSVRAIERYRFLSESFDAAKFSHDNPVDFETVPWPVLHSPVILQPENIDWASVETFFEAARRHMRTQDYKGFVEKSHKRFHPDRWRARGVLKSVEDEELRGCLEVAANTVAQALTPIWKDTRG